MSRLLSMSAGVLLGLAVLVGCTTRAENEVPTARLAVTPELGTVETEFTVDASGSTDPEEESRFLQVRWDLDGDGVWDTLWGAVKVRKMQFSDLGSFPVRVEVKDSHGATAQASREIVVGRPVQAVLTVDRELAPVDSVFTFDGSESVHVGGSPADLRFQWDFEGDGVIDESWSSSSVQQYQFSSEGVYSSWMWVRNQHGITDSTSVDIEVLPHNDPPSPAFTVTPSSGTVVTEFLFDAGASSDIQDPASALEVAWDWEADGDLDVTWTTTKTASHQFTVSGDHKVKLHVRDTSGVTAVDSTVVGVTNTPPSAVLTVSPEQGDVQTSFQLDASGSSDPEEPTADLQIRWDYEGDGDWDTAWGTGKQVQRVFTTAGTYFPTIAIRDLEGLTDSDQDTITVINQPPTAAFTVTPSSGDMEQEYSFDGTASTDPEYPDQIQARWDWEGDGTWDTAWSQVLTQQHTYSGGGDFTPTLVVEDTGGLSDTTSVTLSVTNTPPAAAITYSPASGDAYTTFTFSGSNSTDTESALSRLLFRWDFQGDGTWDTDRSSDPSSEWSFSSKGSYSVTLEVLDPGGLADTTSVSLEVSNAAPTAYFSWQPHVLHENEEVTFDATGSDDPDEASANLQVRWDLDGDGGADTAWMFTKTVLHSYPQYGCYDVTLEVKDSEGAVGTTSHTISVAPEPAWYADVGGALDFSLVAVASDGTLFIPSRGAGVHSFSAAGVAGWTCPMMFEVSWNSRKSVAIGQDGTLYAGSWDGKVYALDPSTGALIWEQDTGAIIHTTPAIGPEGNVYVGNEDGELHAFTADGIPLWELYPGTGSIVGTAAVAEDSTVYVATSSGVLYAVNPDGGPKWSYSLWGNVNGGPALGPDGNIYIGDRGYHLSVFSPEGELLWTQTLGGEILAQPAIDPAGNIFVCASGRLYSLTSSGGERWSSQDGEWFTPVLGDDGTIYVGGANLKAYAPDGTLMWSAEDPGGGGFMSPAMTDTGRLIATTDSWIFAFDTSATGLALSSWPKYQGNARNTGRRP